jgi:hypothetical protein
VLRVWSVETQICHIQHPGGDIGQFLLSLPVLANGFFFEIFIFETTEHFRLRVGGPQIHASAIIDHCPFQDAICILRLKVAKNFQLIGNPEIRRPPNI